MYPWEFHPAIVHFPIAFLFAAAAMDVRRILRRDRRPSVTSAGLMMAGAGTGIAGALLGFLAFYTVPAHTNEAHVRMYWHMYAATATLMLATPVAIARWRSRHSPPAVWARAATITAAALLGFTGFIGGQLVTRGGAGVEPHLLAAELRGGGHGPGSAPHGHGTPLQSPGPGPSAGSRVSDAASHHDAPARAPGAGTSPGVALGAPVAARSAAPVASLSSTPRPSPAADPESTPHGH